MEREEGGRGELGEGVCMGSHCESHIDCVSVSLHR